MKWKDRLWYSFCFILGIVLIACILFDYKPFKNPTKPNSNYQELITSGHYNKKTYSDFENTIKNKENAIYYLGYEGCPWCEDILPILTEVLEDYDCTINYIDTKNLKEDEENHSLMQNCLKDILKEDKKIYVPNVILIKEGIISSYHLGTVEGHIANERELTLMEIEEIKEIYEKMIMEAN